MKLSRLVVWLSAVLLFTVSKASAQVPMRVAIPGSAFKPEGTRATVQDVAGGRIVRAKALGLEISLRATVRMPDGVPPNAQKSISRLVVFFRSERYGVSLRTVQVRSGSAVLFTVETNLDGDHTRQQIEKPATAANAWSFGAVPVLVTSQSIVRLTLQFPTLFDDTPPIPPPSEVLIDRVELEFQVETTQRLFVGVSSGSGFASSGERANWRAHYERHAFADVNGDGKADFIGFVRTNHASDDSDVWVALSNGAGFGPGQRWHDYFCTLEEQCAVGDVNGDGKADLISFVRTNHGANDSDVWVALSNGAGFGAGQRWNDYFCTQQEACAVGDVTGDRKADVLALKTEQHVK